MMRTASIALIALCAVFSSVAHGQVEREPHWVDRFVDLLEERSTAALALRELEPDAPDSVVVATLASHFRSRQMVSPLWVFPFPDAPVDASIIERADKAVDHLITTRAGEEQYGDNLPWFSIDKELATLSRFPHFDYLGPSYAETGDERYAAAMVKDMLDFVEHVHISDAEQYHVQVDPRINPWNWVLLQWRTKRWMDALTYLRASPSLSDADYLRIVLYIWDETEWLTSNKNVGLHNGTLGNVSAILYAALHFPEAAAADTWLVDAGRFFDAFLDLGFYPGEFLIELTVGYSEGTLRLCLDIFEAYPAGPLKDQMAAKLERLVEAHVGIMKPDRSLPRYGDHAIYDITDRLLRRGAALFDRPDFAAAADNPDQERPFGERLSFPFESDPYYLSGYYAMRDGWSTTSQYLSMDAGPYGTNHHHADKLSITVSADGAAFIVDPGTSLYRSIHPGPRIDLRPGYMHNIITLDGSDPHSGWDRHYGFDVLTNRWVTEDRFDFLEGVYEFRANNIDAIWRRSVLYIKGEYWIVIDALLGDGRHRVESNFQFAIDSEVAIQDDAVVATAAGGQTLHVSTAPDNDLSPEVVIGDTTFPGTTFLLQYPTFVDWVVAGRGWVGTFGNESPREPTRTYPAPALVYSGTVDLPHYAIRVLSPSAAGQSVPATVTWVERSAEGVTVQIERDGHSDVLGVSFARWSDPRLVLGDDAVTWTRDGVKEIDVQPR